METSVMRSAFESTRVVSYESINNCSSFALVAYDVSPTTCVRVYEAFMLIKKSEASFTGERIFYGGENVPRRLKCDN